MSKPITIEIRIDRTFVKRALVILSALGAFAAIGVAIAMPMTFQPGAVLEASQLNGAFSDLDVRVKALEARPKECGYTGQYASGALDKGYKTLFAACPGQGTCGNTAHVCTAAEMSALKSAGGAVQGVGSNWILDPDTDCRSWTSAAATDYAATYDEGNQTFSKLPCSTPARFLCCESS